MSDLFYVFGLALTAMALIVAFVGMRMEKFPSRPAMIGTIALMTFLVVGSAAYAVILSREEHEIREEEIFEYREEQAELEEEGENPEGATPSAEEPVDAELLDLTSPEDGALEFVPEELTTTAGEIVIDYKNPSEVPHNVAIEDGDETISQGETVTGGDSGPAAAELEPGTYLFYCSVPGHREAGMVGDLIVK